MKVKLNEEIPNFELPNSHNDIVKLSDFKGKKVVLYFYPKDNTKGCTIEANEFKNLVEEFNNHNTVVIGISKDSVQSHSKFKEKNDLNFTLLSDEEVKVNKMFDVYKMKKMYGKEYLGTVRSTFIIDEDGKLIKEYRNIKSSGHAEDVLEFIKNL